MGFAPKGEEKEDIPACRRSPIILKIETTFYFPDALRSCRMCDMLAKPDTGSERAAH